MKVNVCNRILMAGVLLAVGSGLGPVIGWAQPKTDLVVPAAAVVADPNATTNTEPGLVPEATGLPTESQLKAERRNNFRNTFDQQIVGQRRNAVVAFGKNAELKTNQTADAVVAIGGSASAKGKVRDAVVAIGGDVTITGGEVGDAVVAVLGNVKIQPGSTVHGEVVAVGGKVEVADGATVDGEIQVVDFGMFGMSNLNWLKQWLIQCVFKLRPLALAPGLGWIWILAGLYFLFYLFVAVALPRPVEVCLAEINRRPATTFLLGLLGKVLLPLILVILAATGVGVVIIPFLLAALFFGTLFGKVAFLEYLGQSVGRAFGMGSTVRPVVGFLLGSFILTLLYLVPILGLITFSVTGMWGLGVAITAAFGGLRRELPERPGPPPSPPTPAPAGVAPTATAAAFAAVTPAAGSAEPSMPPLTVEPGMSAPPKPMPVPLTVPNAVAEALNFPRASFWERLGAGFLDVIIVSILGSLVGGPPQGFLVALAYFAGMWAWKGTTVGGVVLNLKVVRLDDKPVTFAVALVRALAAAFSVIVLFLGFLWLIWDREKQTWHDKIAGTVVIRLPRGMPLVCL